MRSRRRVYPSGGCIGIDPGSSSGAISYVAQDHAQVWPIKNMTERDIWQVVLDLSGFAASAVLEKVSAMPRQGVSSTFKFGTSYGELRMALVASEVPFRLVTPTVWQKAMGCLSKGDKNVTKTAAQRLFPGIKMTHAKADALLIGAYGFKTKPLS